ncbi:MAG: type II secretion system protein [Oscillospiraceae bacterium]|nr:type II secretion system protein [Oscillospiraceae bacterium]
MRNQHKKVKGFTLIELIVVMAIFGLILASAMLLLSPTSKLMLQADMAENSAAQTSNISKYLELEFASAERIDCYNNLPNRDDIALEFAKRHYEGVLAAQSSNDPASANYATGRIHVMQIENKDITDANGDPAKNAEIHTYVYDADFTMGNVTVTEDTTAAQTNAINLAAYNTFNYEIKLGSYTEDTWTDVPSMADLLASLTPANLSFSIKATTKRLHNDQLLSYYSVANTPLVNVQEYQSHANANNVYFMLTETIDPATSVHNYNIVPATSAVSTKSSPIGSTLLHSREYPVGDAINTGGILTTSNRIDNYTFVYSYGSEIDLT